jgi:hypothetical protein
LLVFFKQIILRDTTFGAAHNFAVCPASLALLFFKLDSVLISHKSCRFDFFLSSAFRGSFCFSKVDALTAAHPSCGDHDGETYDHVRPSHEVVDKRNAASYTEWLIDAVLDFTFGDSDTGHANPSYQEHIKPHVENEQEVFKMILCSNASI